MTPTPARRVVVVLVLVAALLGAVAAERLVDRRSTTARVLPGTEAPEAHPTTALSSSWYCPGGPADGGPAGTALMLLNPLREKVRATVRAVPVNGEPGSKAFDLGPSSATAVVLRDIVASPWTAAVVDVEGGGVVVEQSVGTPSDFATMPCAPAASSTWYFASGSTARDAALTIGLFNPFPDDAIVDLAFATPEGRRVPGNFEGVVVPAHSVLNVDIGSHLRRQEAVSTEVRARAGRIIAGQLLVRTAPAVAGVSLTLGAPALGEQWVFPDGFTSDGVAERYEFFNPGMQEARIDIEVALDEGEVEPFEITIPAQGRFTLNPREGDRIPKGVPHAAIATSVNGVPVVATRVVESTSPRAGRSDTLGARRPATRWGLAFGSATETSDEWVIVFNSSAAAARVSLVGMASGQRIAIEGLQNVEVPAGRRVAFRVTDHIKRESLPLVVEATRAVYVERAIFGSLDSTIGVPLD